MCFPRFVTGVHAIVRIFAPSSQGAKDTHRLIGIEVHGPGLPEYLDREKLGFPVITGFTEETAKAWNFAVTPQTIVIEPGGRLRHNWTGAYNSESMPEVSTYFGIKLPGLLPETGNLATTNP